ncbi:glycosyltransferase family 2 protein [Limnobacter sp.]|uniref:glycosyltransferase family 2 protein n=1 Tax=Limnobacter sp. TaxID=2003368 RepID=UPI0039189A18
MNPILSICIPTMNRAGLMMQALQSIHESEIDKSKVQICVSNNCSDENYDAVLALIEEMRNSLKVDYIHQAHRLSADENMLETLKLARGDRIYFLGDDDYFLEGQLPKLMTLIDEQDPDLAIFNGIAVDANNINLGTHFTLPPKEYVSLEETFVDLRDKGSFGAILVKRELLKETDFRALFGTSHAYGCYWIPILNNPENLRRIIVPDFPLVALRTGKKTYNHLKVYFSDIPYEIETYKKLLKPGLPQKLNKGFERRYYSKIESVKFLIYLIQTGMDLRKIESINPEVFKRIRLRTTLAYVIYHSGIYGVLRLIKRRFLTTGDIQ